MADPVIRFCRLADGTRVAFSTHGSGPLLVCPAWWVSHLERDWEQPAFRGFFSALAQHRTVVRYDRPGVGLSDRDRNDFLQKTDVEVLHAIVAHLARPTVDLLAFSCAAPVTLTWAAANPGRVQKLVLIGAYATIRVISNNLNVPLQSLDVDVQADCDVRGTLLVDPSVRVGFKTMRVSVKAAPGPGVSPEQLERLVQMAEQCCVVLQTLKSGVEVALRLDTAGLLPAPVAGHDAAALLDDGAGGEAQAVG